MMKSKSLSQCSAGDVMAWGCQSRGDLVTASRFGGPADSTGESVLSNTNENSGEVALIPNCSNQRDFP